MADLVVQVAPSLLEVLVDHLVLEDLVVQVHLACHGLQVVLAVLLVPELLADIDDSPK